MIGGFWAGSGAFARDGLGIGAPLLAAVAWSAVVAPKAPVAVSSAVRLAVEGVVFGLAVAGLVGSGHPRLAWALAVAWAVNRVLSAVTNSAAGPPPR